MKLDLEMSNIGKVEVSKTPVSYFVNADGNAERVCRRGCRALRHRATAARGSRLLRQVPGPNSFRKGLLPAGGVSVLLARVRDAG